MPATPTHLELAAQFPTAEREQWRELARAVLRKSAPGRLAKADDDPEVALSLTTADGIAVRPLYTPADADDVFGRIGVPGAHPYVRGATAGTGTGWDVRQRHADPDAARTNAAVLNDLECGVTSVWLVIGHDALAVADLPRALEGVYLDLAPIALDAGSSTVEAAEALFALAAERGVADEELAGTLGADPIGLAARSGGSPELGAAASLAVRCTKQFPQIRAITVDASAFHDGGATDADEIALAASSGVAYLRALVDAGLDVDAAAAQLTFRFAVGDDQFTGIAKLRAARRVWARIAELSGVADGGQRQHAVTSAAMMTRRDPWVNMLRTTIACFAAAVGGAQAVTVAPFDAALGLPDDLGRRIARNTHAILHDESSLARVADPAGGSWYVEDLTEQLAAKAWDRFTALERAGGVIAGLADGSVAVLLADARAARARLVATRATPITGVSEFPNIGEKSIVRAGTAPSAYRLADGFEALRDRSDAYLEKTGTRPGVVLAGLGTQGQYSARAGFAANLFQAGGFETVLSADADGPADLVCLCSTDAVYAEQAESAAARFAGAKRIWLAGKGEFPGVTGQIFAGCDALAVLQDAWSVFEGQDGS